MYTQPTTENAIETVTRYVRSQKPTVQLRRPTCTELLQRPDLIAQLVLSASVNVSAA